MGYSYRNVDAVGTAGSDAEVREVGSRAVMSFSLACGESWTGRDGQRQDKTVWIKCSQWFEDVERARKAAGYILKGALVHVHGKLEEPSVWTDREGNTRVQNQVTIQHFSGLDTLRPPRDVSDSVPRVSDNRDEEIPF